MATADTGTPPGSPPSLRTSHACFVNILRIFTNYNYSNLKVQDFNFLGKYNIRIIKHDVILYSTVCERMKILTLFFVKH